jgi:hypothetical protein
MPLWTVFPQIFVIIYSRLFQKLQKQTNIFLRKLVFTQISPSKNLCHCIENLFSNNYTTYSQPLTLHNFYKNSETTEQKKNTHTASNLMPSGQNIKNTYRNIYL